LLSSLAIFKAKTHGFPSCLYRQFGFMQKCLYIYNFTLWNFIFNQTVLYNENNWTTL